MSSFCSQSVIGNGFVLPKFKDDDERRIFSIPGFSKLPEATRHAFYEQYEAEQGTPTLDLDALDSELLALTPPPDPNAYITRARGIEEQARRALFEAGCPPCYPIGFELPVQTVPEEYEALPYYLSLDDAGLVPLRVQLSDWEDFRDYQKRVRRFYLQRKTLGDFEEQVRDRRRRHNLEEHVSLCPEVENQTRSQNMIEFQNYHLDRYERLKDVITTDRSALVAARKALETDASEDTEAEVEDLQWKVEDGESKVQRYEKLLRWIEQQRITISIEQASPSHDNGSSDQPTSTPTPTSPGRRKKKEKPCTPLRPVRSAVSKKPTAKRWSLRSTRRDAPQAVETASTDKNVPRRQQMLESQVEAASPVKTSTLLRPSRKGAKTAKEVTPLRPLHPQKVTKTAKNAPKGEASATIKAVILSNGRLKRPRGVPECASGVEKRRSGRKVKRPER